MTGETIHVQKAVEIGLVQEVVETADEMMKAAQKICEVMQYRGHGCPGVASVVLPSD
jgi:enoyl-CoA hydratase/carnithine racemase